MCHTVAVDKLDHLVRHGWTQAGGAHLPEHAVGWLRDRTGLTERSTPVAPDSALAVPPSRLGDDARKALEAVVGHEHVLTRREDRLGRTGGMSYLDLLGRR